MVDDWVTTFSRPLPLLPVRPDTKVVSNLLDRQAGCDEIEDLAPEIVQATMSCRSLLECLERHPSGTMAPPDPGHINSTNRWSAQHLYLT
ncbi:hypothetical protein JK364_53160 [Streptomyces sp. 110]|uniref:Uncharacterized protein n=1 Tax=Streptomyces endocoffeicus TaxID=2898945 RepID=A0ABS1Q8D8_9ACTN|nr:hypothetical protein [Streptomyces endocoffeicus]MBL1120942.1 hypothetical protein [Streptomyces endocoffeicus]